MNYYYLAASLPALEFGTAPALDPTAFRALCAQQMRPGDLAQVEEALAPSTTPARSSVLLEWQAFDSALRAALARLRAARLDRDAAGDIPADVPLASGAERAATEAMSRPSPLDREAFLDRARWRRADELAGHNPFAVAALVSYALKLRIAARWTAFSNERGAGVLEAAINAAPEAA